MIVLLRWLWVDGLTIYPFIFIKKDAYSIWLLNHECIHIEQQKECLFIFAYLIYALEFIAKLIYYKSPAKAYKNISFEREAFIYEAHVGYIKYRKRYNWIKYIWQK